MPTGVRPIAWRWSDALYGLVCAVPAALVALDDVPRGLAFAFGVLPGVIVGVGPRRRRRASVVVVGTLMGASILIGSLLAEVPWLAVASLPVLCVGAALLARRHRRVGMLALTLALPLVGVGLSYTDRSTTAGLALLLALGSCFAFLVALAWPEQPESAPAPPVDAPATDLLPYGLRLGVAAAIAAAIGFAADWDHVGWAAAACMLVMRPAPDLVTTRAVGRILSVVVGAVAAVALAELTEDGGVYAIAIVVVLVGASATRTSRWYVTSAFTTFVALSLLAYGTTGAEAAGRFNERVAETILGVALAFVFGTLLPQAEATDRPRQWLGRPGSSR